MNAADKPIQASDITAASHTPNKVNIPKDQIGDGPVSLATDSTWILQLVNMTDKCFAFVQVTDSNGAWGKWYRMTPACRTCNLSSYDACFAAKAYVPILVSQCTAHPFSISIATEPDADGNALGYTWNNIIPNCQYSGTVIGIAP
jgi:hypothetical protein